MHRERERERERLTYLIILRRERIKITREEDIADYNQVRRGSRWRSVQYLSNEM